MISMEESNKRNMSISKEDARQFLVKYHNFDGSQNYNGSDGIIKYFYKVRSIQYDPLNVVGRNADLVLQSKISDYKPEMLQKLLYKDHLLVDGFDKEMCIYLSEDYPCFERIRAASAVATKITLGYRNQLEALEILEEVRDYIRKNGPIGSNDISIGQSTEGRWGHRKLSSAALDYLYTIGELCVANKNGTQKVYDFTENILPYQAKAMDPYIKHENFLRWYVKRRIGSVGLLWDKSGGAWQGHYLSNRESRETVLDQLVESDDIIRLYVEDIKAPFYIQKEAKSFFADSNHCKQVKFLAPLDNLLWDRDMVSQLFHFDYRWEVYTPVSKRKFGYYVLPVLYGDQLIARFEPDRVKKNEPFKMINWWWEPEIIITNDLLDAIEIAVKDFCRYLDVEYSQDYFKLITKN